MQYVRSISGSVSKTWNSINPATLSGAIDVIVVEDKDGNLACSPFHIRYGKLSISTFMPQDKKVEFRVRGVKQEYAMKLGEGGEAFFVFETSDDIPEALQTSPLVSPASSPPLATERSAGLQEPDFLDLATDNGHPIPRRNSRPSASTLQYSTSAPKTLNDLGAFTPLSTSPGDLSIRPTSGDWSGMPTNLSDSSKNRLITSGRFHSDEGFDRDRQARTQTMNALQDGSTTERSHSPPPLPTKEAIERAMALSKQLSSANIPSQVTETGDLMLDMTGYKSSDDDAFRAEIIARKILSEELEGDYDIGALIGADEHGNLWIYSSEEAKEAAVQRAVMAGYHAPGSLGSPLLTSDASSDPGYHSDADSDLNAQLSPTLHRRAESVGGGIDLETPPQTPPGQDSTTAGDPNRNYAKTLRLTSDQLKALNLKPGPNPMSFTVNRATCTANMYLWKHDVPVVISDIDGTITKSDALGHVLNMIGRDWTHIGVAKLYTEIVANGYNIMYLTSRSVGLADNTRSYLAGVVQDGYRLPQGPTIMSPDRTIAAMRRELYIRKPEVFKMACLRDIKNLFGLGKTPFYAGFGNRLTDALSYRSVSIPSNRIFTINSNAEVSLDLLSLNKLKLSYVNMREVVDHYFPPVSMLVKGGGEEFTDFNYWRDTPLDLDDFSDSESEDADQDENESEDGDEGVDDEEVGEMGDSYISQNTEDNGEESVLSNEEVYDDDEEETDALTRSMLEAEEATDDDEDDDEAPTPGGQEDESTQTIPSFPALRKQSTGPDTAAALITGLKGMSIAKDSSRPEAKPVPKEVKEI